MKRNIWKSGTYINSGPIKVSPTMQNGEKFIRWEDDSSTGIPVTMRVDPMGFYIYWIGQNYELDSIDIVTIRDVRTGQYAKIPKDAKLREIVTMGPHDTLEEKTITISYGWDFPNMYFMNFCCTRKEIAQHWCEELMKLAYNLVQANGSTKMFLQKAHTRMCLQLEKGDRVLVRNIVKVVTISKEDRRRVEGALEATDIPAGKMDTVPLSQFRFEDFYKFYKNLVHRSEVETIFNQIVGSTDERYMRTEQFVDFLNRNQRDPRLNEILFPYANTMRGREIIQQYEPDPVYAKQGLLSCDGFLRYLMSDDNPIMTLNKLTLCDDMDQPLSHYFINSSHNTYLAGHQLMGTSSVEMYRHTLLAGCRCVELDFWNGRTDEPVLRHGYTLVPEIFAKDVLEAIAESAFKTSEYPVILSFDNHCNKKQQAKIAQYCRDIFGDMLLDKPLDSYPLESNVDLPPPSAMRRKIIIKNKKKHNHHHKKPLDDDQRIESSSAKPLISTGSVDAASKSSTTTASDDSIGRSSSTGTSIKKKKSLSSTGTVRRERASDLSSKIFVQPSQGSGSSDSDSSSYDEAPIVPALQNLPMGIESSAEISQKETEAGAEISALVNYIQPTRFTTFENAEKRGRWYEMSSFDEKLATTQLKEHPIEFVKYNKHQISRIYPQGTRFDSSNFMPQIFWNAGCQLVALNFQTLDLAMQLNLGIFEYNGRTGYLLKPDFMRRTDRRFDPFAESTVDGIVAGTVSITVLSGQFLTERRVGTYVEVDMFGLPADTVRKKFRTKIVPNNGINPVYDEEPFVFKKVVLPELASVRIAAYEEGGRFIGHRVLPVIGLCPGYRHLNLRTEVGHPMTLATLFLFIIVKDFVPDDLSDFAEALANPIKYQNELEKRDKQLAVLTEGTEPKPLDEDIKASCHKKELRPVDSMTNFRNRASLVTGASTSIETCSEKESESSSSKTPSLKHQHSIDQSMNITTTPRPVMDVMSSPFDLDEIIVEPLEKLFEHKLVREKRLEMKKKLDTLRKKHDKDKIKMMARISSGSRSDANRKTKFPIANKLVRRLSSKSFRNCLAPGGDRTAMEVPHCRQDASDSSGDSSDMEFSGVAGAAGGGGGGGGNGNGNGSGQISRTRTARLRSLCRECSSQYRDLHLKYYENIYATAEKVLKSAHVSQVKQLKASLSKVTNEIMHQLQEARRVEVKNLAAFHRDRDELERMKREVASSVVERGVSERLRLNKTYERRSDELQRQHEAIRSALADHKAKARHIVLRDTELRTCVSSHGFLVLFQSTMASTSTSTSTSYCIAGGGVHNLTSTTTTTTTTTTMTTVAADSVDFLMAANRKSTNVSEDEM